MRQQLELPSILTPLAMVYRPSYLWYFDPPIYGILNPLPMVFWPPYPWYIEPPTNGNLTPLSMVYWPPTHDIWTPVNLLIRNEGGQNIMGVQFTIQGGSDFNKRGQYGMDENWPMGQYTMGVKIPYDTGNQVKKLQNFYAIEISHNWVLIILFNMFSSFLSPPNNVWRLIVFAPFLIIIIIILILILIIIILLSFRSPWTCPRQISGTTGQNFMTLGGVIDICF